MHEACDSLVLSAALHVYNGIWFAHASPETNGAPIDLADVNRCLTVSRGGGAGVGGEPTPLIETVAWSDTVGWHTGRDGGIHGVC